MEFQDTPPRPPIFIYVFPEERVLVGYGNAFGFSAFDINNPAILYLIHAGGDSIYILFLTGYYAAANIHQRRLSLSTSALCF